MQKFLLFAADGQSFDPDSFHRIIETIDGFYDVLANEPGGAFVRADFSEGHDTTTVRLNSDQKAISLTGFSGATFEAIVRLQQHIRQPLRIIDLNYTFDLNVGDFANAHDLRSAIEHQYAG